MPLLLSLIERGILHPESSVTRRFALEDVAEAYDSLERREIVGRAVVTMPSPDSPGS